MPQIIELSQRDRVLLARIDNPPHNYMDRHMLAALERLTARVARDRSVGAVVMTGAPAPAFVTHYDVAEILDGSQRIGRSLPPCTAAVGLRAFAMLARLPGFERALRRTPAAGVASLLSVARVFETMNRSEAVFIAAINGTATGGGAELALACDLRLISSDGGPIGQPEILLGLIPGGGSTQRLTRTIGEARTLELLLEGRLLTPGEALELGLVHAVVPAEDLLDRALEIAERLGRRSRRAVGYLKRAVYGGGGDLAAGMRVERALYASVTATPSALNAMRVYVKQADRSGPPFVDERTREPWLAGTAVELNRVL
jgi:enoyl-CoA hydratase